MREKIKIGEIVERSKKLEAMLKSLKAEGRGMHELISSIQEKLDVELNKKLRFIATIRNQAIHEPEFDLDNDFEAFCLACEDAGEKLEKMVKPTPKKRTVRKKKEEITPDGVGFNYLFLLPFIPGLNIVYFIFIWILSLLSSSKYIAVLVLYLLSFASVIEGIIKNNEEHIIIGAGIFVVLYMYNVFIPPRHFPKLRYVPLLNVAIVIANTKTEIYWKLFFIANIFIILSIASGFLVFIREQYIVGAILFGVAYVGGIIFFVYAGKRLPQK